MSKEQIQSICPGNCDDLTQFAITMAFQPVVDVEAQNIYAYEALVRGLTGESAGEVLAGISEDQMYAFDQCCRVKAIELAAKLGMTCRLNINFMPNAVYHPRACLQKTINAAREFNFPAEMITFEFTENELVSDHAHLKNIILTYQKNGYMTAIDDFGAGYSGLNLLADFQTDKLKIDRQIIINIDQDKPRQAILAGILLIAKELGISVVCEGVETVQEYKYLKEQGIRYMQGYFFARPKIEALTPASEIDWLF